MEETTMALLTGLLGTAIGAVLIGGALLAAYLVGRERGHSAARAEHESADAMESTRLGQLEEAQSMLRLELDQLRRSIPGSPESLRRVDAATYRTPH